MDSCFGCRSHSFVPLLFLGDSRGQPPKKKNLTGFVVILTHGCLIHFFFLFLGGPFFLFNNPAWGILSLAVGSRETGQGH